MWSQPCICHSSCHIGLLCILIEFGLNYSHTHSSDQDKLTNNIIYFSVILIKSKYPTGSSICYYMIIWYDIPGEYECYKQASSYPSQGRMNATHKHQATPARGLNINDVLPVHVLSGLRTYLPLQRLLSQNVAPALEHWIQFASHARFKKCNKRFSIILVNYSHVGDLSKRPLKTITYNQYTYILYCIWWASHYA